VIQLRKLARNNKGQFIVIAVLMISIMVISVATIMYSAVTYYRHERWEEYLSIIDNVEMGSYRLLELSLANYTLSSDSSVLTANLNRWQRDLLNTYAQYRVVLGYSVPNGGTPVYYNQGLSSSWNQRVSFSTAKASFNVSITSVGLTGYKFTRSVLLNLTVLDVVFYAKTSKTPAKVGVRFNVTMEGMTPLVGVLKSNILQFRVNDVDKLAVSNLTRYYDNSENKCYVYEMKYLSATAPSTPVPILIRMVDYRNIKVVAQASISQIVNK